MMEFENACIYLIYDNNVRMLLFIFVYLHTEQQDNFETNMTKSGRFSLPFYMYILSSLATLQNSFARYL